MKETEQSELTTGFDFDNRFTRDLPADPETSKQPRQVTGACYSRVRPATVPKPQLIAYASEVAQDLGLSDQFCNSELFVEVFSGNQLLDGMDPYAMCYGGHQFGNWAGQLGDGRAINLGEITNANGERRAIQLKGAGLTPYSRSADGLAVLRSSLREFLCSEAMHHLGVPTTRALSVIASGQQVVRDMLYDGNPKPEQGAIVCRVAPSFTRFGNFQIFAARGEVEVLRNIVHYTIQNDFPHLGKPNPETYLEWFNEVCQLTAEMVVQWLRVGFVHGVMNTDNMSILGLTIDYGPYGWLEDYDPNWTPNTTDAANHRYAFGKQPQVAHWNLVQLANAIYPLINQTEPLEKILQAYGRTFETSWQSMMTQKLGLRSYQPDTDEPLFSDLLNILQLAETDMTIFYRRLASVDIEMETTVAAKDEILLEPLRDAYYTAATPGPDTWKTLSVWLRRYSARAQQDHEPRAIRMERMNKVNPKYVLRNYLAQLAIDKAEEDDSSMVETLLEVLRRPYDEQTDNEVYAAKRPDWARTRVGCSMLSCSS